MITKHLFKRGTAVIGALLAMSAAVYAADPSTFPAPTGDTRFVPAGANSTRVRRRLCVDRGRLGGSRRHDLFQRYHFHQVLQGSVRQIPAGRQHLEAQSEDRRDDHLPQPVRHVEWHQVRPRRQHDRSAGADYGGQMLVKTDMKTGKSYILTACTTASPTTR